MFVLHFFPLNALMDNDVFLTKAEVIKRYRLLSAASHLLLSYLRMLPCSCIGKDLQGKLYFY